MTASWQLGYGKQDCRVFQRLQTVTGVGDLQQITGPTLPGLALRCQTDPPTQHVHRGLPGVAVFPQFGAFEHADHRLAQHPFMTADDGVGGGSPAVGGSQFELLTGQSVERDPLHGSQYACSLTECPTVAGEHSR